VAVMEREVAAEAAAIKASLVLAADIAAEAEALEAAEKTKREGGGGGGGGTPRKAKGKGKSPPKAALPPPAPASELAAAAARTTRAGQSLPVYTADPLAVSRAAAEGAAVARACSAAAAAADPATRAAVVRRALALVPESEAGPPPLAPEELALECSGAQTAADAAALLVAAIWLVPFLAGT